MGRRDKYGEIRKNKDIARWYKELRRGSETTAKVYLRRLGLFCTSIGIDPFKLLKMKDRQIIDILRDYITDMEERKYAGGYTKGNIKAVKSWLVFNGIKLSMNLKVKDSDSTPTLDGKQIFSQDDLRKVLNASDPRGRVAIGMIAFSGIRIQSLGNESGTDGIRLGDIEGLSIDRNGVKFEKVPAKITIRKTISKKRNEYFTFLGQEGCNYIRLYLNERINQGEEINKDSPLITYSKSALRNNAFITRTKVSDLIRKAIRTAGYDNRPYDLRPYFASRLLRAQDERLITRDYRTFFMGHKGDIENTYTTERLLSSDMVESMRSAYLKSTKYLETERKGMTEDEMEIKFRSQLLMMAGFTEDEITKNKLLDMNADEITKMARDKLFNIKKVDINAQIEQDKEELSKSHKQKVIPIDQVEEYINNGFIVKMALGNDRVIVEYS